MTQEQENLLLKDLCARLPYGVKIESADENIITLIGIILPNHYSTINGIYSFDSYPMKPYLFPLSSMTEEQNKELKVMCDWHNDEVDAQSILVLYQNHFVMKSDVINWLIENHFDYRGLIPMGLANDATGKNIY